MNYAKLFNLNIHAMRNTH